LHLMHPLLYVHAGVMALYELLDCLNGVSNGIIRGIGKQGISSLGNLVACYFVLQPLCYLFAFHWKWAVLGLWRLVCIQTGLFFIL
jgi:Na+-driven multidrug efflux pump